MRLSLLSLSAGVGAAFNQQRDYLLVDPAVVPHAKREGWQVVVTPPQKEASNPLLIEDKLWDVRWDNTYPTVRYDEVSKKYRMWYNAFIGGLSAHPSWNFSEPIKPWRANKRIGGLMYAESDDGVQWTKPPLGLVTYPWNGTAETGLKEKTNLIAMAANEWVGVMYDLHEVNASRRYKAFGTLFDNLCRQKGTNTPKTAVDGDFWPACHNLGVAYSSDGVHFDHAADESKSSNQVPAIDKIGQNDGALDLAMFDPDLEGGTYWGLVRLDVFLNGSASRSGGQQGFRRTGRFTTKDFASFSKGEQVFHGRAGYEVYTIQPFRLPSYRSGYYLATAMFYNTSSPVLEGFVDCELLQSTDFGKSWQRVASEGTPFIPRGAAGAFDSHTVYTAWGGDRFALLDPRDENTTLFYYAGGNGPHSGARDDSIGLARSTTHAFAGLRPNRGSEALTIPALPLHADNCTQPALSILAAVDRVAPGHVSIFTDGEELKQQQDTEEKEGDPTIQPEWIPLHWPGNTSNTKLPALEIKASDATVYAVRVSCK